MALTKELILPTHSPTRRVTASLPTFTRHSHPQPKKKLGTTPLTSPSIKGKGVLAVLTVISLALITFQLTSPALSDHSEVLREAHHLTGKKNFQGAIALLEQVPARDPVYEAAQAQLVATQRAQREEEAFIAGIRRQVAMGDAKTSRIAFRHVLKSPQYYVGFPVSWSGQIAQISEKDGKTTAKIVYQEGINKPFMVSFDGRVDAYAGDRVTVYGKLIEAKEQESSDGLLDVTPVVQALSINR